jgi:transmembrane sensor
LVAAGIVGICAFGTRILEHLDRSEFTTERGERRELTLADGSLAQLAPNTDIVVRFQQRERLIELQHGEATFHVARNPNRPFIVRAGLTHVLAVGTVFNVERGAQDVSVEVVEGRVAVSQQPAPHFLDLAAAPPVTLVSLGADERVSVTLAGVVSPVRRLEHAGPAASPDGELAFENETIAEVARRFNHRNSIYIDITSPQLGDRRVSGVFRADDPQSFVDFIRATSGAQVAHPDPTHVTLSLR